MDVIAHMQAIPSIGTITEAKSKKQVQLELDMYFDELMHIATGTNLEINANTMRQYVASPFSLKNIMHTLSDKLDRGAKSMYLDAT